MSSAVSTAAAEPTADALPSLIRIGTRSSILAKVQTDIVAQKIRAAHPSVTVEVVDTETVGDKNPNTPLHQLPGKGLWTEELEALLLAGKVDLIAHSLKDLPTNLPDGFTIGAIVEREDPRDVFVARKGSTNMTLASLPAGAVVGTSSIRRMAQLRRHYPDLILKDMRGNIHTRTRKLDAPAPDAPVFDGLILAAAGLLRMDWGDRCSEYLSHPIMLYGVGQGAIGIEIRAGDGATKRLLECCNHTETMLACEAEREVMRKLEGGCSVPVGVDTTWLPGSEIRLRALVASVDGKLCIEADATGKVTSVEEAKTLGQQVASDLVKKGAQPILDEIKKERTGKY